MVKKFNMHKYCDDQLRDAFLCPLNRFATMVEHSCNEYDLHRHPEWLVEHYIRCGGAKYWEQKRKEYEEEIDDKLEETTKA